jgi:hypothetical protein
LLLEDSQEITKIDDLLQFDIKPQKDYEKKLQAVKDIRNKLILDTDFLFLPDYPVSGIKKIQFEAYRQILRDLPSNITDIENVIYPERPSVELNANELIVDSKIKGLLALFNSFYPELKAAFSPAKDAVIEYLYKMDIESATRVIQRYPLPSTTFVDDNNVEHNFEDLRAEFIRILSNE